MHSEIYPFEFLASLHAISHSIFSEIYLFVVHALLTIRNREAFKISVLKMGGKKKKSAGDREGPSSRERGGRTGQTSQDVRLDPKMAGRLKEQNDRQGRRQGEREEDRKRTAAGGFAQLAMASVEQKVGR